MIETRDLLPRTHREIKRIRSTREQLEALNNRISGQDDAELSAINLEITAVLETVSVTEESL